MFNKDGVTTPVYFLLIPAFNGKNYANMSMFIGKLVVWRGSAGAYAQFTVADVDCFTAYNYSGGAVTQRVSGGSWGDSGRFSVSGPVKVKYQNNYYLAAKFIPNGTMASGVIDIIGYWENATLKPVSVSEVEEV